MRAVLVTAGLGDKVDAIEKLSSAWDKELLSCECISFGWQNQLITTEDAKSDYLDTITRMHNMHGRVALVGVSAGIASSLWAAEQLPKMVSSVIDVCGAIMQPRATLLSRHFGSNAKRFDEILSEVQNLSDETIAKLTILRPFLLDGLVRGSSFDVPGAKTITIPRPIHGVAANFALRNIVPKLLAA